MSLSKEETRGVGQIPSGLFIVCARDGEMIDGYLASFIQQVSFSPLLLALAVKPGRPAYDLIKAGRPFSINVVGDHDSSFLRHFWTGYDPDLNPFREIPHTVEESGTVTLDGAKAVIEARLVGSAEPGDHLVVFAEVASSRILNDEAKPFVHLRKSGLEY
ncbi:flavin reductase family protein [bacterium]|nr:flavin reductase family protein [bacterium]